MVCQMKTHSFFMKLFAAFTLLVILPVAVIYIVSDQSLLNSSESAIGNNCVENLKTADKAVRQLQNALYKDSLYLALNKSVTDIGDFGNQTAPFSGGEQITLSQVLNTMVKMDQSDDIYYSIYLYLDDFGYIFTSDSDLVKLSDFADTAWIRYYQDYKDKKEPVSFINTRLLTPSGWTAGTGVYITSYIYPITPYISSMDGAIVMNLKESAVSQMINGSLNGKSGNVQIIDTDGEIVSDIDSGQLCRNVGKQEYARRILDSKKSAGYFICTVNSTRTLVSYYKTGMNNWIYVGKFPIHNLMDQQKVIQRNTLLITLLVIAFGILTAFLISRKIYAPLRTMVRTIRTKELVSLSGNEDEMGMLLKAVNAVNKDAGMNQEKVDRKLMENDILKILTGGDPADDTQSPLDNYFDGEIFLCVMVEIDHYNDTSENYGENQWSYMKNLMIRIVGEAAGKRCRSIGCSLRKGEVCLVLNFRAEGGADPVEDTRTIMETFRRETGQILTHTFTIGIGAPRTERAGIRDSYLEAQGAAQQKLKLGIGRTIVWESRFVSTAYYYPLETEEQIRNLLEAGRKEELLAKIRELIASLRSRADISCENITQILTQMVGSTLLRVMIERCLRTADVFGTETSVYSELARLETLDEIEEALVARYSALLAYTEMSREPKKTADRIEEYLNANCRRDIGVNDISEYLGLSYSYVRKVFKAEKGVNIPDYLNSIRIRNAKALLQDKSLSIKSIATLVGYNNNQSFERYFKKSVGITPAEYRLKM